MIVPGMPSREKASESLAGAGREGDGEDTDAILDVVMDRMLDLHADGLPIFVATDRAPARANGGAVGGVPHRGTHRRQRVMA
jgi:hypothetical protein